MSERIWQLAIVGAGPAGIAAAVEAARVGVDPLLLDARGLAGGTIRIAHEVRNVPFVADRVGGAHVALQLAAYLARWGLLPVPALVDRVRDADGHLLVQAGSMAWWARMVLVATGTQALHPSVPGLGEAFAPPWYASAEQACEQRVPDRCVVVGGSDVAMDQARWLRARGCEVTVLHRGEALRAPQWLVDAAREEGVLLRPGASILRAERSATGARLHVRAADHMVTMDADALVAAIGRAPAWPNGVKELVHSGDPRVAVAGDAKGHRARHVVAALGDGCVVATGLLGQSNGDRA